MSFSSEVKYELAQQCPRNRHCMIAELAGILFFTNLRNADACNNNTSVGTMLEISPADTNAAAFQKYKLLLHKAYDIEIDEPDGMSSEMKVGKTSEYDDFRKSGYQISPGDCYRILADFRLLEDDMPQAAFTGRCCKEELVRRTCCKRAFIRGAFLAAGSMSDPRKSYHFEIACRSQEQALQMQNLMAEFDADARIAGRKSYYMLYVKEGEQIVDMLNVMEAYVSLMKLENMRIVRQMRGSVNRRVNCETANIQKTVDAAVRQVEDIELIRNTVGLDTLSPALKDMALLRLEWPQATLQELGDKLDPPVGKSGVNHRLRKISQMAEKLRNS